MNSLRYYSRILKRRLSYLSDHVEETDHIYSESPSGCKDIYGYKDIAKFYGYQDSDTIIRKISLELCDIKNNHLKLKIKSKRRDYDLIYNNILDLPRDVNNVIYSFLLDVREINWNIEFPIKYPFENTLWELSSHIVNGKDISSVTSFSEQQKIEILQCGSLTVTQFIEKEILMYLLTLDWFN